MEVHSADWISILYERQPRVRAYVTVRGRARPLGISRRNVRMDAVRDAKR